MTEVIDSRAFSEFCGIDSSNQVPDGDTIGRFRNILVKNGIKKLFSQVVEILKQKGVILKETPHNFEQNAYWQFIISLFWLISIYF